MTSASSKRARAGLPLKKPKAGRLPLKDTRTRTELTNRIAELEAIDRARDSRALRELAKANQHHAKAEEGKRAAMERYDHLRARCDQYGRLFDEAVAIIAESALPASHRHALTQYLQARARHIDNGAGFEGWARKFHGVRPLVEYGAPGSSKSTPYLGSLIGAAAHEATEELRKATDKEMIERLKSAGEQR